MKVKNYMSTELILLKSSTTLGEAAGIFLQNKIDGAPVVDDEILVGLFTKNQLIRAIVNREDFDQPIKHFMSKNVKTLYPDEDIRNVDIMYTGRYPVVDGDKLVGFITKSDIMIGLTSIIEDISGQLQTIVNSAYNPIIAIDYEGRVTLWNQTTEKFTGLSAREVIGKYINNIIPESELLNIVNTGKSQFGVKLRIGNKVAITNRAPIFKNEEITGAVAVLSDISELEQISQELAYVRALNKEMDAIIDCSFDGLYITDGQGNTLRINDAIERITGLGEKELLNRNMSELVSSGILSRSASLQVIQTRKPVTTTLTTITGTTLLVSATPVFDEDGQIIRIVTNVRDISELNMLKQKLEQMEGLKNHFEFRMNQMNLKLSSQLVYKSKVMENIYYQALKIAEVDTTVLISGESGVGKEVVAEIIKRNSTRKNGPFVKLNCAAIPENLLESELFGYEGGAFTGAKKEGKPGMFEVASGGTLLLDEIGDLPIHLQVKLLRALQQREIYRVGSTRPIKVDVRIIAITNRDLEEMVENGQFRKDLFYRLNVVPIYVPPLRERPEDIPLLVHHFLEMFNQRYNLKKQIDSPLIDLLMRYNWPGNIRQLENLIERLTVTISAEVISIEHLPDYFMDSPLIGNNNQQTICVNGIIPIKEAVETVEKSLLQKTLAFTNSYNKAAELLGIDASTVSRKVSKYQLR